MHWLIICNVCMQLYKFSSTSIINRYFFTNPVLSSRQDGWIKWATRNSCYHENGDRIKVTDTRKQLCSCVSVDICTYVCLEVSWIINWRFKLKLMLLSLLLTICTCFPGNQASERGSKPTCIYVHMYGIRSNVRK